MKISGRTGWAAIAVFVIAWDELAPETLTDAFRCGRHSPAGRVLVPAAWAVLTAHLFGLLPRQADPFTQLHRVSPALLRAMERRFECCHDFDPEDVAAEARAMKEAIEPFIT